MSPDRDDRSGAPDPDVDALFAQIVAGWDDEQTTPVPPWPASEDLPDHAPPGSAPGSAPGSPAGDRAEGRASGDRGDRTRPDAPSDRVDRRGGGDRRGERGSGRTDRPDRRASGRPEVPGSSDRFGTASPRPGSAPSGPAHGGSTPAGPTSDPRFGAASGRTSGPRPGDPSAPSEGAAPSGTPGPPAPGPRDWAAADEPDEGFVPPEPPPLPRGDLVGRLAWAGVLFGPAFLLLTAFLWDDAGPLPLALGTLAFVGGFVTLVARMPARRDDSDDDGAVV